jgi:arabinose-5-phosphate isomerase
MSSAKSLGKGSSKSSGSVRVGNLKKSNPIAAAGEKKSASRSTGETPSALGTARRVLRIEAEAIAGLIEGLDARFEQAVELLYVCTGRIVVTGLGKSGLIGRKIAATFASTGSPSFFLHAAEALHGDLGMLTASDILLAISSSGETDELVELFEAVKRLGIRLITLTARPQSTLARASDIALDIAVKEEACSLNLAPTASIAAAMAIGDALAISLLERRGFNENDFAALHPGGGLGKKLRRIEALMHWGEDVPRVLPTEKMPDVIYEMSRKGLGLTAVTEPDGRLLGIITDGDLRRVMQKRRENVLDLSAADCLTRNPVTISRSELAATALRLMEEKKITSVLVVSAEHILEGIVHIHDLWTLQIF